jgi:DNA-binding NtrC family response regulator
MDLNYTRDTTSGQEGLELLNRIQNLDATLPVIVMTAWGSVELAVEAMRRGARDFIQKPWDNARLSAILKTQIELGRALRKGQRLEAENRALRAERFPQLIAQSAAMRPVLDVISRVGPSDANVLITGENGTGKGLVAQTLHSVSLRSTRPLVTVNTGGLAEGVFESELFGHVKGAFTDAKTDRVGRFEMADGGTLFLDEIANISQGLQAKLLRTLETGEFERVGSSRRPMPICRQPSPRDAFARTCCSVSIPSSFACPRYAIVGKISRCWRRIFCGSTRSTTASPLPASTKAPSRRCWRTVGRATFANWTTRWNAPC